MKRWRRAFAIGLTATVVAVGQLAYAATIQVGYSPEGSAQILVLNVIDTAQRELRVMAYSFTAADITKALLRAHRRGVDVRVVADEKESRGQYEVHALNALVSAGVPVRVNGHYAIQHDKVIVADGRTVQTGSFNYTSSAEKRNSENAVVIWDYPTLAKDYLKHWQSRWDGGTEYRPGY